MAPDAEKIRPTTVQADDKELTSATTTTATTRTFKTEDVLKHNSPTSAWCSVHGRVLDITEFAKRHPGGDVILLSAGKDATILFETYHPAGVPPAIVDKLQIGVLEGQKPSFYSWDSGFYPTLRKRVVERLKEKGLDRRGSGEIWIKAVLLLAWFWGALVMAITTTDNYLIACLWSICWGFSGAFVGTCIQHDGNHGAFSKWPMLNKIAGWTQDMMGASAFTWEFQHMLGHHPYTNLLDTTDPTSQESDPDVFSSYPLMRMHPQNEVKPFHKYQHLYAPFLFGLMTLSKCYQQDVEVAWNKKLYHLDAHCRYGSVWNVIRFWGMKLLSGAYCVAWPCFTHGIAKGLFLCFIGHFACGELLATMFIVNHVIDGVSFAHDGAAKPYDTQGQTPMESTQKKEKDVPLNDWAAVQCQTSVNWSKGSWFWNHFSGGLSHQIEHHLFPSICHTNYVYIQDVVESTCQEFGVPYQAEDSLWTAYWQMKQHLYNLGNGLDKTVKAE